MSARPSAPTPLRLAAVAAAAVTPLLALLASDHTLAWRDTAKLFGPMRSLVVPALRGGHLPLWNPHEAFGVPLFAQMMHGVLHPVSVLAALFAPAAGPDLLVVTHVALAAAGASLLARTLGASHGAAAIAGLGYALSGYVLGMSAVLQYLGAAATAPWTIAALVCAGRTRWGPALAAAGTAALHLAGDPQWTIVAVIAGVALAGEDGGWRAARRATAGVLLGTALAAVQLVPGLAFLFESARSDGLTAADRARWALSPLRLPELVAPGWFGGRVGATLAPPVAAWLDPSPDGMLAMPFVPSVFLGAALLALAAAGAGASRRGRVLALGAAAALWLALGGHAGAGQLLGHLPLWRSFRYAEKLVGPLSLLVALLAALGADRLERDGPPRRGALVAGGGAALLLALALAAAAGVGRQAFGAPAPEVLATACAQLSTGLTHAAVALAGLALALAASRRLEWLRLRHAALALVAAESVAAMPFAVHAGVPGVASQAPLAGLSSADGPVVVAMAEPHGPWLVPPELDAVDRAAAAQSRLAFPSFNVAGGIGTLATYTGVPPRRVLALYEALPLVAMRRYGLTHVIATEPRTGEQAAALRASTSGGTVSLVEPEYGFAAWAVPHRPWAAFADRVLVVPDERAALRALGEEGAPVVLQAARAPATSPGKVLSWDRRPEQLRVVADAPADGVLVVNDAWWPGWQATIDGHPVPIWRADYAVRAVSWPAGRHVLQMRYEPPEVRAGAWMTLATALLLAGWAARLAWRGRGSRAGGGGSAAGS